jgi:dTDP-glucose 4,6-dehydratase
MRHTADISKISQHLGWRPRTDWEQGLQKTIKWYRENESWWRKQLWMRQVPIITSEGNWELH